ncbi:MAG: hypothetical protein Q9159_003773 [Coniocarpon cinnabarinum]
MDVTRTALESDHPAKPEGVTGILGGSGAGPPRTGIDNAGSYGAPSPQVLQKQKQQRDMSTAARRRLMRDFKRMQTDPPAGVSASPIADNVMTWNAVIIGPVDTPFEDGTFRLVMQFEEQYPNKPPGVKFISPMFHPNVYGSGELCLDILQNRWSPTYDVAAILTSIQSLLNDPNTSSPANVEASNLYKDNRREYTKRVRDIVERSWED